MLTKSTPYELSLSYSDHILTFRICNGPWREGRGGQSSSTLNHFNEIFLTIKKLLNVITIIVSHIA